MSRREQVGQEDSPLPATLRVAFGLLLVQAIGVLSVAGLVVQVIIHEHPADLWTTGTVTALAVGAVVAAVLAGLGWQLLRRRGWARGPVVALELFFLPAGYFLSAAGSWWLGVPVILAALACIGLLLAPASTSALEIRR